MPLENLEVKSLYSRPEDSTRLAVEVLLDGINSGFKTRLKDSAANPWQTAGEVAGSFVVGVTLGAAEAKPIGKAGMVVAGAVAALDMGSRLLTTTEAVVDTFQHADHFDQNKEAIARTLGAATFDYAVMGVAGGSGFALGRNMFSSNLQPMTLLRGESGRGLTSMYSEAARVSDNNNIAIPHFTADSAGTKVPSYIISERNSGLGKFYLDNSKSIVRVLGEGNTGRGGVGTGFFVNEEGMISTNNHVISGFDSLKVETSDGSRFAVRVLARDRMADLALLQVLGKPEGIKFRPLELADSGALGRKSFVSSIGHPEGVPHEVLAMGQTRGFSLESERALQIGRPFDPTPRVGDIVSNVPVKSGYSGSPLMADNGKVIGVVKAEMGEESLATSVEHLKLLISETQANAPRSGYLDLTSVFDNSFGTGRAFKVRAVDKLEWPVDASTPLDLNAKHFFYSLNPMLGS